MSKLSYYRVNVAENTHDGEGWSVNQWYEQSCIIGISENASDKSIISALKRAKMLKNHCKFEVEYTDSDIYINYLADFQTVIMLRPIINSLENEKNARYLFPTRMTQVFKALK